MTTTPKRVVPLDGAERRKRATLSHGRIAALAWNAAGDSLAVLTSRPFGDVVLVKGF